MQLSDFMPAVVQEVRSRFNELQQAVSCRTTTCDDMLEKKIEFAANKVFITLVECVTATALASFSIVAWALLQNSSTFRIMLAFTAVFTIVVSTHVTDAWISLLSGAATVITLGMAVSAFPSVSLVHLAVVPVFAYLYHRFGKKYQKDKKTSFESVDRQLDEMALRRKHGPTWKELEKQIDMRMGYILWIYSKERNNKLISFAKSG